VPEYGCVGWQDPQFKDQYMPVNVKMSNWKKAAVSVRLMEKSPQILFPPQMRFNITCT
jgi:hypothetical protein